MIARRQIIDKQLFCIPAGEPGARPYMMLAIGMQECDML
jgi:hypothetical protein